MRTTIPRPLPTWKRTLVATLAAAALTLGTALAAAAAATPTAAEDPHGQLAQPNAPDQSQQDTTQARHRALGALAEQDPTLARHRALGALALQEPVAQPTALSLPEGDATLARHRALGALDTLAAPAAGSEPERTLARHRALGALDTLAAPAAIAAQPAARTDPAVPSPGVNVLATLLVGLVGGLVGGAAAVVGWTAMTRRHRPPAAAGTLTVIAAAGVVAATLLLGAAPPAAAATSDSPACADCAPLFDSLRADVAAYVPTTQQPVFLAAIDQASLAAGVVETFPPDPIQPDIVAASVILDRLTANTSDLQAAAVVSDDGLAAITTDINRLEAEFFTPTDPC
jgi:hypothetical protein